MTSDTRIFNWRSQKFNLMLMQLRWNGFFIDFGFMPILHIAPNLARKNLAVANCRAKQRGGACKEFFRKITWVVLWFLTQITSFQRFFQRLMMKLRLKRSWKGCRRVECGVERWVRPQLPPPLSPQRSSALPEYLSRAEHLSRAAEKQQASVASQQQHTTTLAKKSARPITSCLVHKFSAYERC